MRVKASAEALRDTTAREYAIRFLSGGLATVGAWLVAREFGASIGGLFLALPSIFPATATLIAGHEKRRKARAGGHGERRARLAAAADAAGASLGSFGLAAFATTAAALLPRHGALTSLGAALAAWVAAALGAWLAFSLLHRARSPS